MGQRGSDPLMALWTDAQICLCVSGQNFSSVDEPDTETRELLSTGKVGQWVSIGGLQPYSNYSVLVKACNGQGCVESSPTTVLLPPGGQYQTHCA